MNLGIIIFHEKEREVGRDINSAKQQRHRFTAAGRGAHVNTSANKAG